MHASRVGDSIDYIGDPVVGQKVEGLGEIKKVDA